MNAERSNKGSAVVLFENGAEAGYDGENIICANSFHIEFHGHSWS